MTTIKLQDKELLLVEVPKGARDLEVDGIGLFFEVPNGILERSIRLPHFTGRKQPYTFLCTTESITEDIARKLVGDYVMPLVEFANLLDNNNLDPTKCYAILQKDKVKNK